MRSKDRFASISHFIGAVEGFIGTLILFFKVQGDFTKILIVTIYGFSVTFLLLSSGIYHALVKEENEKSLWRRLDHSAIFVMIAGAYTPISFAYLPKGWSTALIIFQWFLALIGIIVKATMINLGRILTAGFYLIMGWIAIFVIPLLLKNMPIADFLFLLGGGLAFTIGAMFYISEKRSPKIFFLWKHDWFHIFVLIGASLHYYVVYNAIILTNL